MINIPKKLFQYITLYPESISNVIFNEILWFIKQKGTNDPYLEAEVLGSKMLLDLRNKGISHQLAIHGVREITSVIIFLKTLKKGDKLLDLGANIGYYALLGSRKVGKNGKVFALEPDKRNFNLLRRNIELNKLNNVESFDYAISDKSGLMNFILSERSNVNTIDRGEIKHNPGDRKIEVATVSLDDFSEEVGDFDYIRMDIEGSEIEVFRGMSGILKKGFPSKILFETHPPYYNEKRNIVGSLSELFSYGFQAKYVDTSGDANLKEICGMGYKIAKIIKTDFFDRAIIKDIKNDDLLELVVKDDPKALRSIYLERE